MNFTSVLETIPGWTAVGAGGGAGFFFIKWFFEWLGGRVDKREALVDQGFQRLDAGTQALIQHLQNQISTLTEKQGTQDARMQSLEEELSICRQKHAESEAKVKRLEATMLGLGTTSQYCIDFD